jgi:hypothetical protein
LNWLKFAVVFIVVASLIGTLLTGGQAQSWFEELFGAGAVFILIVELVPQFIVGEETKPAQKREEGS